MSDTALEAKGVIKRYPGTLALKGVDFTVKKGEIRALLGKNGAGKSTLIKILAGLTEKSEGDISYLGKISDVRSVEDSESLGFRFVSQEPQLMEDLSIAENIALREKDLHHGLRVIPWKNIKEDAKEKLKIFNLNHDPSIEVCHLKVAEKQMLLVLREIFSTGASIIALDEVTTALSSDETEKLYSILRERKAQGQSFIYVSHEIDEVFQICDSATVFRDGEVVLHDDIENITRSQLKKAIAGREITTISHVECDESSKKEIVFDVENLNNQKLKNISFQMCKGEILGVYGLRGAGRTELLKTIFGLMPVEEGKIRFNGQEIQNVPPTELIKKGVGFVPEGRDEGLFFGRPVIENLLMTASTSTKKTHGSLGVLLARGKEKPLFDDVSSKFQIKTPSEAAEIDYLSGGNKQKVMFGRSLAAESKLCLIDEGTKGIDIGAKHEIYKIMQGLTDVGCTIVFTSSDLEEIITVSDRIMVLYDGKIVRILQRNEFSKEQLLHCADGSPELLSLTKEGKKE